MNSPRMIFTALGRSHAATAAELARQTGVDQTLVHAALTAYTQAGRVMFDLDKSLRTASRSGGSRQMGKNAFSAEMESDIQTEDDVRRHAAPR